MAADSMAELEEPMGRGPGDPEYDAAVRQLKAQLVAEESHEIEPLRTALELGRAIGLSSDDIAPAEEALRSLEARHKPLIFTDLPREDMEELLRETSRDRVVAILSRCMGLAEGKGSFQTEVLVEYHYHNFAFVRRHAWCPEKASTFMSIMQVLYTRAIVKERLSEKRARALFDQLLERHSRQLPPYSVGVFTEPEAELFRAFADSTFFRHYKMYASLYTSRQEFYIEAMYSEVKPQAHICVPFKTQHEIADPHEVTELQDLFRDTEADAAQAAEATREACASATQSVPKRKRSDTTQLSNGDGDDVAAAIEQAMQAHFGNLDERLRLPV